MEYKGISKEYISEIEKLKTKVSEIKRRRIEFDIISKITIVVYLVTLILLIIYVKKRSLLAVLGIICIPAIPAGLVMWVSEFISSLIIKNKRGQSNNEDIIKDYWINPIYSDIPFNIHHKDKKE